MLTTTEAAKKLGISRWALMREVTDGNIIAHKRRSRWRFTEEDIQGYIGRNRQERKETVKTGRGHVNIDELKKSCPHIKWSSNVYNKSR